MQYWLMKILRTPDESFENLAEYDFKPNYVNVIDEADNEVRMHYITEGEGETTILLLHGQPSWSYLYRKIIKCLRGSGARVLAPDLIGFGRSDIFSHKLPDLEWENPPFQNVSSLAPAGALSRHHL